MLYIVLSIVVYMSPHCYRYKACGGHLTYLPCGGVSQVGYLCICLCLPSPAQCLPGADKTQYPGITITSSVRL